MLLICTTQIKVFTHKRSVYQDLESDCFVGGPLLDVAFDPSAIRWKAQATQRYSFGFEGL
jgi:hypothetical protein